MAGDPVATKIVVMDREYSVRCSPEEQTALKESARYLTERMTEARGSGRSLSHDRITIMTALNIASDYLRLQREKEALESSLAEDLDRIALKLESSFARRPKSLPVD